MASIFFLRLSPAASPKTLTKPYPGSCFAPPLPLPLKFPSKVGFLQKPAGAITITRMSYNPTPATDRLISAVAYTLPFFNSLQYGRFLFAQYPSLCLLFDPLIPLLTLYKSIPYASFVDFFALYWVVLETQASDFSQYVRFNSMQDVLLVVPLLLARIFNPGRTGLGFKLMVWGHNDVFLFSCCALFMDC